MKKRERNQVYLIPKNTKIKKKRKMFGNYYLCSIPKIHSIIFGSEKNLIQIVNWPCRGLLLLSTELKHKKLNLQTTNERKKQIIKRVGVIFIRKTMRWRWRWFKIFCKRNLYFLNNILWRVRKFQKNKKKLCDKKRKDSKRENINSIPIPIQFSTRRHETKTK